ncbi:VCBS domain-containing protein [Bradyrhizobium sp. CB2312]|uniref:VCBS domain-containing protein n=1 Tax=Bradyrhizobium sp. CB2312 TaxID=3039155 RepID=UPI0024B17E82|nr:VCBS domain-containing protein [Bradyrhizobium sp. CB2312]WFU74583.1 VCBS domain-containing protein [Bradyrhizobium sp. CB2312]
MALPLQIIGTVQAVFGYATLRRDNGAAIKVRVGDLVCRGDVIETAADAQLGIRLLDDTVFNVSSGACIELREFACDVPGSSRSTVVAVTSGSFAFAAGRLASSGALTVDTPFGSVRGRSHASGFGILTMAALTFSTINDAQATDPDATILDDDQVTYKDLQHGVFELITKEQVPRHIIVDDPGETIVVKRIGSSVSVSQVANSAARMEELQAAQHDVLANLTRGTTGSSTPPFGESLSVQHINFTSHDSTKPQDLLPPLPPFDIPVPIIIHPPPSLGVPAGPVEVDTIHFDQFTTASGTFTASSSETGAVLAFGLSGGTSGSTTLNGVTYNLSQTGPFGTLFLNSTSGAYAFVPNNDAINALQSPTTTSFLITVSDGSLSVSQAFTININGANDAAIISGNVNGTVAEAGGAANAAPGAPTATGTLTDVDVDNPANTFTAVSSPTRSTGGYGFFTVTTAGVWTYTLDNANHAVQALNVGDTLTDTLTVTSVDGTPQVVTVTIHGSNDAAIISGTTASAVTEASSTSPGTSIATGMLADVDVDNPSNTFVAAGSPTASVSGYGSFTMTAAGVWTYTLDNANTKVQALNNGQTLTDSFTVTTVDGTAQVVTITINGSNDAAVISGQTTGCVTEAGGIANGKPGMPVACGTLTDTDPDNPPNTFVAVSSPKPSAGGFGTFTMTAFGTWTYTLDNGNSAVQALNACGTLTDTFTVTTIDGTPQVVTIKIIGTNDAAIISGTTTGSVLEAGGISPGRPVAVGTLTDTDVDNPANCFTAVTSPTASDCGFGTFTMTDAGVWTYTLDNCNSVVNALDVGDTLRDHFTVTSIDGTRQEVTISIHGASDGDPNDFDNLATGTTVVSDPPFVYGTPRHDSIAGGGNITQIVYGGAGNDTLNGTGVNDAIFGGSSNDTIKGNNGDDAIYGGSGQDTIDGCNGNDTIIGGLGVDKLTGGNGKDVFVYLSAVDSRAGRCDTINDFASGCDKIDLTALGALGFVILALNFAGTSVPARTIAWLYDSSANETVVYVNPTDQTLRIGDSSLVEIHLQGITSIDSSDFIVDPTAAPAAVMADAIGLTAMTQSDTTVVAASTSSLATDTTAETLPVDQISPAQAANVSHSNDAGQSRTGPSEHPSSSGSDGTATPSLVEMASVSSLADFKFVFEQIGKDDNNHPKAISPISTATESHSGLEVPSSTPDGFLFASAQHTNSGSAAEAPGDASAADTGGALDSSPSNESAKGSNGHSNLHQANGHGHLAAEEPGAFDTRLHSKANGAFGSEANPHAADNFKFLNPGHEKSSTTFVDDLPSPPDRHGHAGEAKGHADAAPMTEASHTDNGAHNGHIDHPVQHDLIV